MVKVVCRHFPILLLRFDGEDQAKGTGKDRAKLFYDTLRDGMKIDGNHVRSSHARHCVSERHSTQVV